MLAFAAHSSFSRSSLPDRLKLCHTRNMSSERRGDSTYDGKGIDYELGALNNNSGQLRRFDGRGIFTHNIAVFCFFPHGLTLSPFRRRRASVRARSMGSLWMPPTSRRRSLLPRLSLLDMLVGETELICSALSMSSLVGAICGFCGCLTAGCHVLCIRALAGLVLLANQVVGVSCFLASGFRVAWLVRKARDDISYNIRMCVVLCSLGCWMKQPQPLLVARLSIGPNPRCWSFVSSKRRERAWRAKRVGEASTLTLAAVVRA